MREQKKIVVFASGNGTNAENLIRYFQKHPLAKIVAVFTNNEKAGVIRRTKNLGIACKIFDRHQFTKANDLINELNVYQTDLIVLAGFLWKIPKQLIQQYPKRIINIHPALLPDFGGKGMYGQKVHEAVIRSGVLQSGISIHLVNENYDEGEIIFQAKVNIENNDDAESLAAKIHLLEYKHFPQVVERYLSTLP
jgi:phosphoribosylglycinamide formyltransferase-1